MRSDDHLLAKAEVLELLARSAVAQETIAELATKLSDPVDLHTDGALLQAYGVTRDALISRLGGSP
jgi:hypothetical protein